MFEKLKEYGTYVVLGLIALGALAYSYVQTSNNQKGAEIHEANLDAMVTAISKSDKLKKSSTVAEDLLAANGGRTIGKYKIDPTKVSYVIGETYNDVFDNKRMIDVSADLSDIEEGQLRTILIAQPAVSIDGEEVNTINLNSDQSLTYGYNNINKNQLSRVANELKGYSIGALGYGIFNTYQEAKDFRDTYFSSYEIYEIGHTGKFVILIEYNTTGVEINIEGKVEASTTGEGTGEQNQEQTGNDTCNEYLCLASNGVTMKAKAETICGNEYEYEGTNYYVACNKSDIANKIFNESYPASNIITSKITDISELFAEKGSFNQNIGNWDVSNVTNMSGVFGYASAFNQDISNWNTSNVIDMSGMFANAGSFNQDISSWNTGKVTNMSLLFGYASEFNQDISSWNTSHVTNMNYTFFGAEAFNQDISPWNISNVTEMSGMFSGATSFNQDISPWNISNLSGRNMSGMFSGASSFNQDLSNWNLDNLSEDSIKGIFKDANQLSNENYPIITAEVTKRKDYVNYEIGILQDLINNGDGNAELTSSQKTQHLSSLQTIINNVPLKLNTEHDVYIQRVTNMETLISNINALKTTVENDLIQNRYCHNTTQENNGNGVCENAIYLDSNGVTLKAKPFAKGSTWYEYNGKRYFIAENKNQIIGFIDGEGRFKTGKTFTAPLGWSYRRQSDYYYDTVILTKVTDLSDMFKSKNYRKYGDISSWDVSHVTNFSKLFYGRESDFDGNLYYWDTSSATDMSYMFGGTRCLTGSGYTGCAAFKAQGINSWDVSHVTNFEGMFRHTRFNIDLNNWNTSSATNMKNMFNNADMRKNISNWNISNVTNADGFDTGTAGWNNSYKPNFEFLVVHDGTGIISVASNGVTLKASNSAVGGYLYSFQGQTYYVVKNKDDLKDGLAKYGNNIITSKVTSLNGLDRYGYSGFGGSHSLRTWDTSNVTNMSNVFNCTRLTNKDLQYWDTSNVTSCSNFRNNCYNTSIISLPTFTNCTP